MVQMFIHATGIAARTFIYQWRRENLKAANFLQLLMALKFEIFPYMPLSMCIVGCVVYRYLSPMSRSLTLLQLACTEMVDPWRQHKGRGPTRIVRQQRSSRQMSIQQLGDDSMPKTAKGDIVTDFKKTELESLKSVQVIWGLFWCDCAVLTFLL